MHHILKNTILSTHWFLSLYLFVYTYCSISIIKINKFTSLYILETSLVKSGGTLPVFINKNTPPMEGNITGGDEVFPRPAGGGAVGHSWRFCRTMFAKPTHCRTHATIVALPGSNPDFGTKIKRPYRAFDFCGGVWFYREQPYTNSIFTGNLQGFFHYKTLVFFI